MSQNQSDAADKSFEPTAKKLEEARKQGEIAKSVDLITATSYAGLAIALVAVGGDVITDTGSLLMQLLAQSDRWSDVLFGDDSGTAMLGGFFYELFVGLSPIFVIPAVACLAVILAQRAFVVTPSKLAPKLSRISLIQNAKNKFGRSGLFEFAKSFMKLLTYSVVLGFFLNAYLEDIVSTIKSDAGIALTLMSELALAFLFVVVCVAGVIGGMDAVFQYFEHRRKNMMSRKEIMDEVKESEGDPYVKQERRARAQAMAAAQMISDVPKADVIVVNPTHYAVALQWDRTPGSAPKCVAKGVDSLALRIREVAQEHAVPIHSDPPTARALHASIELGEEIAPEFYQAVAAAIRFADELREKAKGRI